ncbi:MAG: NADH-quinone oxidoreductase subunit NuoE [Rhodospirillales bacterium]|nr:NADH-quinone oxidoreductase subunit NuoE [Alphaproteobacteria bacterium]MCB9987335.1 NADH-quinone oxidoreductase subunit NuoE [Rhodospirillales bacterium]USO07812.1 MAG: NADH-quinone oxidoreductase subunit NuoE [Rhodospirillales bacterium]
MKPRIAPPDQQPEHFAFADMAKVKAIIARYPEGRQQSAVMPLLDLVMRQTAGEAKSGGGWIPEVAMDEIARILEMPKIKVYEVATFYSMYILAPVGKHHIQCCTTTPCWLRGSADIVKACEEKLGIHMGETTPDMNFTLSEVECLGACVNAPMVQINDEYYEDLTPARMKEIIDALAAGKDVPKGPQNGRRASMSAAGPTTLVAEAKKAGVA